jgi:hypothetical protein
MTHTAYHPSKTNIADVCRQKGYCTAEHTDIPYSGTLIRDALEW